MSKMGFAATINQLLSIRAKEVRDERAKEKAADLHAAKVAFERITEKLMKNLGEAPKDAVQFELFAEQLGEDLAEWIEARDAIGDLAKYIEGPMRSVKSLMVQEPTETPEPQQEALPVLADATVAPTKE